MICIGQGAMHIVCQDHDIAVWMLSEGRGEALRRAARGLEWHMHETQSALCFYSRYYRARAWLVLGDRSPARLRWYEPREASSST